MPDKSIQISGGFCLFLALTLLLVPLQWLWAALSAAALHELCHYIAIRFLSSKCQGLKLYSFAAMLPLPEMSRGKEVICALSGPVGGLCLLALARWAPRLALCGAIQSVYNLLPIYPLDGGRALRSGLLLILSPPKARAVCHIMEILMKVMLCVLALYGCFWLKLGIFPLLMVLLLLIRVK